MAIAESAMDPVHQNSFDWYDILLFTLNVHFFGYNLDRNQAVTLVLILLCKYNLPYYCCVYSHYKISDCRCARKCLSCRDRIGGNESEASAPIFCLRSSPETRNMTDLKSIVKNCGVESIHTVVENGRQKFLCFTRLSEANDTWFVVASDGADVWRSEFDEDGLDAQRDLVNVSTTDAFLTRLK